MKIKTLMRAPENIKCLGKSLIKHASDLYTERYKKLPRDIKENLKNWDFHGLETSILLKYQFSPN